MEIFYRPLYRKGDKEPGKHSRVCSCHFSDGKKSNGPEMFERVCRKYWLKQPDGAFIITLSDHYHIENKITMNNIEQQFIAPCYK